MQETFKALPHAFTLPYLAFTKTVLCVWNLRFAFT